MSYYLIHITPVFAILSAVVLYHLSLQHGWMRVVSVVCCVALCGIQTGGILLVVKQHIQSNDYALIVAAVRKEAPNGGVIIGTSALFWGLPGQYRIIDDFRLGYYSKRSADLIVISPFYSFLENAPGLGWETGAFVKRRLSEYRLVYSNGQYLLFKRVQSAGHASIRNLVTHRSAKQHVA